MSATQFRGSPMTPIKLTYAQAKGRIWNPEAHTKAEVREAAVYIIGTLGARREDVDQAALLL